MNKTVTPGYLHGELRVLPSKSASHRAVMMAALARGKTLLEPMQLSKDIGATLACAQALGLTRGAAMAAGETEGFVRAEIWGGGEAEKRPLRELDCGESGSTLRFFIPLALDGRGPVRLIGHGRLMQRPLTVYQNLFAPLGVVWRQEGDALTVEGELKSGRFELPGDVSSQFITGLLLALPLAAGIVLFAAHLHRIFLEYAINECEDNALMEIGSLMEDEVYAHPERYASLVQLDYDSERHVTALRTDVVAIGRIKSRLVNGLYDRLDEFEQTVIEVPLGSVLAPHFFSGRGPSLHFGLAGLTQMEAEFVPSPPRASTRRATAS